MVETTEALITQEETGFEIVRDEKGRFVPGRTGNPAGRPKKFGWGEIIRKHKDVQDLINKVFKAALDDKDPRQETAWRILMDKIAPNLKAEKIQLEGEVSLPQIIIHVRDSDDG